MENKKFKEKIWQAVKKIPRGEAMTYKEVAELIGHPRSYRAVGNILNTNRDPAVPCHRVIRSDGKIGGYKAGTFQKRKLLQKEGFKKIENQKPH